jgi:hypothetical protein
MNIKILWVVVVVALSSIVLFVEWLSPAATSTSEQLLLRTLFPAALVGMLIVPFTVYLNYTLLDRVEAIVDPIMHEGRKRYAQERLITGSMRIIEFGVAAAVPWANRRNFPDFDFRALPRELRLPLVVQFYGLMISGSVVTIGWILERIAERMGWI